MSKKIYSLKGLVGLRLPLTVDGKPENVEFTGGTMQNNYIYGGNFATDNPKIQAAIEGHGRFKSGQIFVKQTVGDAKKPDKSPAGGNEKPDTFGNPVRVFPGVTNAQQAREVLISEFGVEEADLSGPNAVIVSAAKKAGAGFPDWAAFNA
jgi:hypothetical protein